MIRAILKAATIGATARLMDISAAVVAALTLPARLAPSCRPSPGSAPASTRATISTTSFPIMIAAAKAAVDDAAVFAMKAISPCTFRRLPTISTGVQAAAPTLSTIAQQLSLSVSMTTLRIFGARLLSGLLGLGLTTSAVFAGEARARADYMIHCQGCHVPDGRGFPDKVPDMRATLPLLLSVEGGRAFLVQVPGSAMSALPNDRLAATLNWIVKNFTDDETVAVFADYTEQEVEQMRAVRLDNVFTTRDALIGHLENAHGGSTE